MTRNVVSDASGSVVQARTIQGGVHFHAAAETRLIPRQLPALARGFTGRQELLAAVNDAVSETADGSLRLVVLSGMAGVGKTSVALSWGHRFADQFRDGQLYVDLRGYGPDLPLQSTIVLAWFLRALGVPTDQVPADESERSALFRSLLAGRSVLLVLDNARSEEQVRPLLPGPGLCVVLVTSRNSLTGLVADQGAALLPVDVLRPDEALELLCVLIGDRARAEPDAAAVLVRYCARLPLALRVVAGVAHGLPKARLGELAEILADERARLALLETAGDSRTSTRTVFSWSYRSLPADAARLFRLLGLVPGAAVSRSAIAALAEATPPVTNRLLDVLFKAQLVVDAGRGRVDVHDLLRIYAAGLAEATDGTRETRAAVVRLFDHYLHGAEVADRLLSPRRLRIELDGSSRTLPELNNRGEALEWLRREHDVIVALAEVNDSALDSRRWQLAYTMRGYFFLTKDWDTWIRTHQLALAAASRRGDLAAEAVTRNNLGLALLERGRTDDAETHYLQAWRIFERLGDEHGAGNAMGNYAWVRYDRGEYVGALECAHRALASYRLCGARTNAAITLRGIAVFESRLGRFDEAIEHLREAMAVFDEVSARLDTAMALNCLGEVYLLAGNLMECERAHSRAVGLAREQGSVFEEARAHRGLGHMAERLGERGRAIAELRQARDGFTRLSAVEANEVAGELSDLLSGCCP